jgi:drug efflux transport system ATP-binding protein
METIVSARDLTRRFDGLTAVAHLNLEVARGEVFGIVGPDGAGKTTTLRMLSGLLDPTEGHAAVAGHDPVREPDAVRDQIGYMAQRFGLYADLTVQENMIFYADLFGIEAGERATLSDQLLRMTRMDPFRDRPAGKLSGGMKQKLALMCTLLHHPRILLLDEPTNGVDPVSRRDFWVILTQLVSEGLTVIVTTAYLEEAERCNRVGLMHKGRMIQSDSPRAIRAGINEECYAVRSPNPRAIRERLKQQPGVVSAEPAGASLHVFLDPAVTSPGKLRTAIGAAEFEKIEPSLEDVFVLLIGKEEPAHA